MASRSRSQSPNGKGRSSSTSSASSTKSQMSTLSANERKVAEEWIRHKARNQLTAGSAENNQEDNNSSVRSDMSDTESVTSYEPKSMESADEKLVCFKDIPSASATSVSDNKVTEQVEKEFIDKLSKSAKDADKYV
ncbi:hypothetical protein HDE_10672 [Halotydeus destructor]|nr:hypothetical protein HDE_10672 [Halotydeus destructor]